MEGTSSISPGALRFYLKINHLQAVSLTAFLLLCSGVGILWGRNPAPPPSDALRATKFVPDKFLWELLIDSCFILPPQVKCFKKGAHYEW
jgi:hypothetical protein